MERIWTFSSLAVTAALIDFVDPALAGEPDVRERGVRLEVRPMSWGVTSSVYSSPPCFLEPARVRIDLLESAPYAADRMHLHPTMVDGDPGDRVFDRAMAHDPIGWVREFLNHLPTWAEDNDSAAIADASETIASETERLLASARQPWPNVDHDERGLAVG